MVHLIRLKSSSRAAFAVALFTLALTSGAFADDEGRLPVIHNVGIIPLQPPRDEIPEDLVRVYDAIKAHASKATRDATKFKVANDNLVASLWSDAEGRAELAEKFEVHGYLNLEMNMREDAVTVYARLLDPKLNIYLVESENKSRSWLRSASDQALSEMTEQLIYRMFNRIPVDATVTSTQDKYITLSAGKLQGLKVGDTINLYHVYVTQTHPANGSWLKFRRSKHGEAHVIEVLERSAVAQLTRIREDGAVRVGDGVHIDAMEARSHFRSLAQRSKPSPTAAKPIELSPLYRTDVSKERGWRPKAGDTSTPPPADRPPLVEGDSDAMDGEAPGPFADAPPAEPAAEHESGGIEDDIYATLDKAIDFATVMIGPRLWKVSGAATAAASFIPANYGGLIIGRTVNNDISVQINGGVFAGITKNGSFTGFNAEGEVYYHKPLNEMIQWRVGGGGGLLSMAVNDEPYGGGDLIQGFISGGVFSTKHYSASSVDWFADLKLRPLNTGQVGAGGSKRSVKSSMGTSLRFGGILNGPARTLEWGGMMEFNSLSLSLAKGDDGGKNDLAMSDVVIMALGRLKF